MSILSEELQKSLDAAFLAARTDGHDLLTVEHLLLALLSDTNVAEVLNATGADLVGSSRVDLQACKLEYSIVSPK